VSAVNRSVTSTKRTSADSNHPSVLPVPEVILEWDREQHLNGSCKADIAVISGEQESERRLRCDAIQARCHLLQGMGRACGTCASDESSPSSTVQLSTFAISSGYPREGFGPSNGQSQGVVGKVIRRVDCLCGFLHHGTSESDHHG
jgi:hypothetical protein